MPSIQEVKNSTEGGPHDVSHFKNIVATTVSKLKCLSQEWEEISRENPQLTDEREYLLVRILEQRPRWVGESDFVFPSSLSV